MDGTFYFTDGQREAFTLLKSGENVFLTGDSGTGKTAVVTKYIRAMEEQGKTVCFTASTGMASSSYSGGKTIHSLLKWRVNAKHYDYEVCSSALKHIDVLIIDECSMLTSDIMVHLFRCLEALTGKPPQIIMVGDFFQLPAVYRNAEKKLFAFETEEWDKLHLKGYLLSEVVRQSDAKLVDNLNRVKYADLRSLTYFNACVRQVNLKDVIYLCAKNDRADQYNKACFNKLPGTAKVFFADGDVKHADFNRTRVPRELPVKVGMRVMCIQNDSAYRYYNGALGTVMKYSDDHIQVKFDNGNEVWFSKGLFEVENKKSDKDPVMISMFPLRMGYAISIHKSQGQTYSAAIIDAKSCWCPGQIYVALSRVKSMDGIFLVWELTKKHLITSRRVVNFYRKLFGTRTDDIVPCIDCYV